MYPFIGNHPSIKKIRELVAMVSGMTLNVLLLGETGTGKDVVARLLHDSSPRRQKKFVKVNCAALPLNLLESELFGYERGAFTGADKLKPGKFELAAGGVMFLDEVGDIPLALQSKLLNVLQSGEYNRLGGTGHIKADSWVITSTNHELDKDIKQGLFREDLYYRLNIIKIELPPLRDRREDIPLLIDYFIEKNRDEMFMDCKFLLSPELKNLFQDYHWPGNVRELSNTVLRLMVGDDPENIKSEFNRNMTARNMTVDFSTSSDEKHESPADRDEGHKSLKELKLSSAAYVEKKAILHALEFKGWNKSEAAKLLKISYKTLFTKINEFGIEK
jgi:two-component system, NtrC family, response regulator AtoC